MIHVRARQATRRGREGPPLSMWLRAGGLPNAAIWAAMDIMARCTPHAKVLGLGQCAEENHPMVFPPAAEPGAPRSCWVPAGWLWQHQASAPSCSSRWRLLLKKRQGKKIWKLSVITQPFLQRSDGVNVFQAKQKPSAYSVPLGTLQSGWKRRDLRRDFKRNE